MSTEYQKTDLTDTEIECLMTPVVTKVYGLRTTNPEGNFASAVAVKIGGRHFLATAAHFLRPPAEIEVVRKPGGQPISTFHKRVWTNDGSDVGLLEIRAEDADTLDSEVAEDGLYAQLGVEQEHHVIVCGFPTADICTISRRQRVSSPRGVLCATVPLAGWPSNLEAPGLADRDLFIDYPERGRGAVMHLDRPMTGQVAKDQATVWPGGLSGGGVWLCAFREETFGTRWPDSRLVGIQVAFVEGPRMLRATSICKWLDLVVEHYPDLKEEVEAIRAAGL